MNEQNPQVITPALLQRGQQIAPFAKKDLLSRRKMNELVARLNSLLNMLCSGGKVFYSEGNVVIVPGANAGGAPTNIGTVLKMQIVTHTSDYLICNGYTAGVADSNVYNVAKPIFLRYSIPIGGTEVIDSVTVTYTYDMPGVGGAVLGQRSASVTSPSAASINEVIVRPYAVGDIINAVQVSNGTDVYISGLELTWLDLNVDCRCWRIQYGQI